MSTKITIEIPTAFTDGEIIDLRYFFADAFGEFISQRAPAELYVLKRYTHEGVPSFGPAQMLEKIEQVKRRLSIAEKLLLGAHSFTLEDKS